MGLQKIAFNFMVERGGKLAKTVLTSKPIKPSNFTGLRYVPEGSTTFVRQNISKSERIIDDFLATNPTLAEDVESLGVRLFKQMKCTGRNYIKTTEVQNLTKITGLTEQELSQNFDNIASLLTTLKESPNLWFRDMPYKMKVKIGKTVAEISPIDRGCSGAVYSIKFPNSKPYVLKKFHGNTFGISANEGCFAEAAIQHKMTTDGVEDIAKLAISNPENGWIVSEFVDNSYKINKTGFTLENFMKKHNLKFDDINGGMYIKDASGNNVLVDFGYIMHPNGTSRQYDDVLRKLLLQLDEDRQIVNFEKVLNQYLKNPKDRFKLIQQLEEHADNDFCVKFYEKVKDTPEMQLYTKFSEFMALKNSEYPTEVTYKELQKLMKECGFDVDIKSFIGNQDFANIQSTRFNDYYTPIFEKMMESF